MPIAHPTGEPAHWVQRSAARVEISSGIGINIDGKIKAVGALQKLRREFRGGRLPGRGARILGPRHCCNQGRYQKQKQAVHFHGKLYSLYQTHGTRVPLRFISPAAADR